MSTSRVGKGETGAGPRDHIDRFLEELALPGLDLTIEGIVDRMMGISRRLKRTMDETLAGFDLTWGEWTVLGSRACRRRRSR
jgi:hypothetical protein